MPNKVDKTFSRLCEVCGVQFFKSYFSSRKSWAKARFCSSVCSRKVTCFKKGMDVWWSYKFIGHIPWNKGTKYSEKQKLVVSLATKIAMRNKGWIGEGHPNWKGEQAGKKPKHLWVVRWKGKPVKCEHCGRKKEDGTVLDWANIDHTYKRNLDDYIALCRSCHRNYDIKHNYYVAKKTKK